MGIKMLAVGAAAAVLLAPGAAVLGVATLISPAAAPTARTLMPMAASPEWVVELREPQDVAAVE